MIVKYVIEDGLKTWDIVQGLRDGGWMINFHDILSAKGVVLTDRKDPTSKVTISKITGSISMFFVHFKEGGWLCLDHAIEQFEWSQKIT